MRPRGLPHFPTGQKLSQDWLDIDDGRSVDGIELRNEEFVAFHANDATDRAADAIRAILGALREDADFGPLCVVPGMTRAVDDFSWGDVREEEEYFAMGEIGESCERFGGKFLGERDARFLVAPKVVYDFGAVRTDESDWTQRDFHWRQPLCDSSG